jgi:hypothetical protein
MHPITQALRVFIEEVKRPKKEGEKKKKKSQRAIQKEQLEAMARVLGPEAWPWFGPVLVFDCEATVDIAQKLRFGVYRLHGKDYRVLMELAKQYNRNVPRSVMDELWETGIFYNTEPGICKDEEIETMRAYAKAHYTAGAVKCAIGSTSRRAYTQTANHNIRPVTP